MRWIDLLRLSLAALGQQKMCTSLTTLGVLFGAFVLAASLSIDEGIQRTIDRESNKGDALRKVTVSSGWRRAESKKAETKKAADDVKVTGRMSPERRERIRKVLAERARQRDSDQERVNLTREKLEALARIPHVVRVVPVVVGGVVATLRNRPEDASFSSGAGEDPEFRKRVVFGRPFESDDERSVLLSEMFGAPDRAHRRHRPGPGDWQAPAHRDPRPGGWAELSRRAVWSIEIERQSRRAVGSSPGRLADPSGARQLQPDRRGGRDTAEGNPAATGEGSTQSSSLTTSGSSGFSAS